MAEPVRDLPQRPRRSTAFWALLSGAALLFAAFVALGCWQLQRLSWKEDLIARLDQRLAAPAELAPEGAKWEAINKADDEYRRLIVRGSFDHSRETLVGASTELGTGYWVITPLRTTHGNWVLINRGFVPAAFKTRASRSATEQQGEVELRGLLRLTEPGGSLLQRNDAQAGRWYSRDVQAIGRAQALEGPVAPYFVDESDDLAAGSSAAVAAAALGEPSTAKAASPADRWPRPGLTVIRFNNNHRSYALTWFAMALMTVGIAVIVWREDRRRRETGEPDRAADAD
ncbi:SURF1 family protein [Roseateles amylovorans]|uniref:SURF1-like protein n=1 Tax=Roseateles amylovorans TaxID=2978473 RepID=A0ABY6B056_9BURK|nr:SURF1 family protein [Roseateles amylovorans]UXH77359.1 SURF1 family protein [Roseateles amylovorans]